ncbi:Disease resistance protein RPP8 [Rhynchospora pubera]|uniref:Disease resistance protein RPP8 n=1 Tax=Rhynchospora pubera TaxID=906938 RepID=A0AAV8FL63_9POAL|nr:Disease resistance protein RPP8 [Rhynchospora pubera]
MAEVLLTAVVRKLTEFAVEKTVGIQSSFKIREEVEKLSRQLKFIQAFIEDADKKHIVDKRQMEWVKNVMDIAYQIEDAIDIFHLECPKKLPGITGTLAWLAKRTTQISFLYKFKKEIKAIHDRILEIEEYRQKYAINTLGQDFGGQNTQSHPEPKPKLDPIGDPEIVGFVTDLDNIIKRLCDKENQSLAVVSIVGPGGIGKTTLARKACNRYGINSSILIIHPTPSTL